MKIAPRCGWYFFVEWNSPTRAPRIKSYLTWQRKMAACAERPEPKKNRMKHVRAAHRHTTVHDNNSLFTFCINRVCNSVEIIHDFAVFDGHFTFKLLFAIYLVAGFIIKTKIALA